MNNLIAYLVIAGGGLSVVYGMYLKYKTAMDKIAQAESQATTKTDLDKVASDAKISNETVIDFDKAVDEFNSNNKPSGSK